MSNFIVKSAEQAAVAAVVAFGGVALAGSGNLTHAALSGAVAAALRAVYGVFVKNFGSVGDPSVK